MWTVKTRQLPKENYRNFFHKSEEFFRSASTATESEHRSATVANAAISGINLVSALTACHLGLQATVEHRRNVPKLLRGLGLRGAELEIGLRYIHALLDLESLAESRYPGLRKHAQAAMKHLRWLRTWTPAKLPPEIWG